MATTTTARVEETDSLTSLEERILRAVDLVSQLRKEKEAVQKQLDRAMAEKESAEKASSELQARNTELAEELDTLKSERKHVRTRIEKLLGQMDLLSAT
jgi:FtsZ-binding cell division protein ZapB